MHLMRRFLSSALATSLVTMPLYASPKPPNKGDKGNDGDEIRHVLLISIDGLHALDLSTYVSSHPNSTLASLSAHGITYTNASTSQPSDSFPGLAALVTGGSPATAGLWYDVTYNRALSPPAQTTSLPITGGPSLCPSVVGTPMAYDESIDFDLTQLNGAGGINSNFLPRDPTKNCAPVFPHQYLKVNTIFEVVKANRGTTAWIDKHPSYEWTNGPSGKGVDDFYGPEINSNPVALPQFPGCSPVPFVDNTFDDGWTTDFRNIKCYDLLHVTAVINQIDGFTHDRSKRAPVPTLFGFNYQAVSVGEKLKSGPLVTNGPAVNGGYTEVLGTPAPGLAFELDFVDQTLGRIVAELKSQGLYNSTLIVICAKHGQSPIDITKRRGIGDGQPATLIGSAEAFDISDDASLIWLTSPELTPKVVSLLSEPASQQTLGIQEIFAGQSLANKWDVPGTGPGEDPRTPDIILKVNTGVIFTGGSKIAEHGGINEDDVHTALLLSLPRFDPQTVRIAVSNQQVAPTIIKALGMDPNELQAVQKEKIQVLPFFQQDEDEGR
jgi:Type I phosphodiesterase / nucleotide pyrophosphatase